MAVSVSLHAVVEEMEMLGGEDGMHSFLNRQTGEIYGGTADQMVQVEDGGDEDHPAWEVEMIHRLREILESPAWLELPRHASQEDYRIMERFCCERTDGALQEELLSAITGRGAFARFKDALCRNGIQDAWYSFRRECLAAEARIWLEAHEIPFTP